MKLQEQQLYVVQRSDMTKMTSKVARGIHRTGGVGCQDLRTTTIQGNTHLKQFITRAYSASACAYVGARTIHFILA